MRISGYNVYCGTFGKYNAGSIFGAWMDLCDYDSAEEFFEACRELHKDEEDPELMFQDTDCPSGFFKGVPDFGEIKKFYELMEKVEEYDNYKPDDVLCMLKNDIDPDRVCVYGDEDTYHEHCEECFLSGIDRYVVDYMYNFIDWEAVYRSYSFDYSTIDLPSGNTAWYTPD